MRRTTIESRPVPSGLRRHALPALLSALLAFATGCTHAAAARQSRSVQAPTAASVVDGRRALPGAGAVAFDRSGTRLAWAAGNEVRILELGAGTTSALATAGWIDDLGFARDGSLWTVGERVQRWQGGSAACTTEGVDADRLLAVDAQGAVVAGYAQSDGVGMLRHQVWLDAACRVADIGARLHVDHRVELAFDQVLRAPVPGQTHAERAWLACVINARYGGGAATPEPAIVDRLLTEEQRRKARTLGIAIRLACDLSGRSPSLLINVRAKVDDGQLILSAADGYDHALLGEQTRKRGKALAEIMGLKLDIRSDT